MLSARRRRDRQRDLALSSSCRGKSGAVLRGRCPAPLAGVVWAATGEVRLSVVKGWSRRERGETRLGATRLAPEAAQTCEGCEAMPEQSVGDNRATQLIGAQRRVNARVRALAALDRKTLAAGTAGRLSGKGRAARYPTRKNPGSPWNWPPRGLGCQHPGEGTIAPRIFLHPPVTCVIRRERLDELLPQTDGT